MFKLYIHKSKKIKRQFFTCNQNLNKIMLINAFILYFLSIRMFFIINLEIFIIGDISYQGVVKAFALFYFHIQFFEFIKNELGKKLIYLLILHSKYYFIVKAKINYSFIINS